MQIIYIVLRRSSSVLLIQIWKVAGVLINLKDIITYSQSLYRVRNVVFHSSLFLIRILWYASLKSSFIQIFASDNRLINLLISGSGCRFFVVILFNARQSIYNRNKLFNFRINRIEAPVDNFNRRIQPIVSFSVK